MRLFKEYFLISLIFFLSLTFFLNILKVGIISDYTFVLTQKGIAIENGDSLFEHFIKMFNWLFQTGRLNFIATGFIIVNGFFASTAYLKIIHFIIGLLVILFCYQFFKKYFGKSIGLLSVILSLCLFQFTTYLDPFIAWPENAFISAIIGFIILDYSFKLFFNRNFNKVYFLILIIFSLFYSEHLLTFSFLPFLCLIFKFIKDKKFYQKSIFYNLLAIFFVYILLKIFAINSNELKTYSGTSLGFYGIDSIKSFYFHFIRTLPLTWMLNPVRFFHFKLYLLDNILILFNYLPIFFLTFFAVFQIIKKKNIDQKFLEKNYLKDNINFINLVGLYIILSNCFLISISSRYAAQIAFDGIGVAHYLVFNQYIGLILLLVGNLSLYLNHLNKFYKILISLITAFLLTGNFIIADYSVKSLEKDKNLKPYLILENFINDNLNEYKIDSVIVRKNNYEAFWINEKIFTSYFDYKVSVYSDFYLYDKKINNIANNKKVFLIIKDFNFSNENEYNLKACISLGKTNNLVCDIDYDYTEKRFLTYFLTHSKLEID